MKFKFTSKSKAQAEKFQKYIKADRNLDSTISEKDGKFYVEYSVANMDFSAVKKKKQAKKKDTPDKDMDKKSISTADMGDMDQPDYMEYDDVMECMSELANYFYQEMQYQLNWVWSEIDYLSNSLYQHVSNGHLPPINGADKMQKALDVLGIGGDYQIQKPIVYASTRLGTVLDVDISAKR